VAVRCGPAEGDEIGRPTQQAEAAMPDHLSIEILGILRGSADGSTAVVVLGVMALAVLIRVLRGWPEPKGD
jgi:hypothetical protein